MTKEIAPGAGNPSAVCPTCNRFIGALSRCPYCHTDAPKPFMLRVLRAGSVVLATAGLALLYLVVTHRETPVQRIADITPLMNHAHVRLVGTVPRDAYVSKEDADESYVSFLVTDDSGSIRVAAQGDVAAELIAAGRLPKQGVQVDVSGSLDVSREKAPRMRLQAARHLILREQEE